MKSSYKKKPYGKMLIAGMLSVMLYAVMLSQQDIINSYFVRGGIYALLPIIVAFIFSVIHGSFTGSFWTVLGIEAARKRG